MRAVRRGARKAISGALLASATSPTNTTKRKGAGVALSSPLSLDPV